VNCHKHNSYIVNPPPRSWKGIIGMRFVRNISCPCYNLRMHWWITI